MAAVKEVKKIAQAMARQTGLVESKAGLPCLAFFGEKRALFQQTPAKTGGPESKKKVHHQVSYM